jgi:hypothetical protein
MQSIMAGPEYVYSPYVRRGVYAREWADLRQRCAVEALVFISGAVAFAGVGVFLSHFHYAEKYAVLVAVPWAPT